MSEKALDRARVLSKNLAVRLGYDRMSLYASVAQLVEQLTLNQLVHGSSPCRGTILTGVGKFTTFTGLSNRQDRFLLSA